MTWDRSEDAGARSRTGSGGVLGWRSWQAGRRSRERRAHERFR
jgi:hypothetical protein